MKKINEQDIGVGSVLSTQRYAPPDNLVGDFGAQSFTDFPYVDDPNTFITHRALENWLREQNPNEEEPPPQGAPPSEPGAPPPPGEADNPLGDAGMDPSMAGADPSMGGMGTGMPGEIPQMSSTQIGRIYELKKIYSRLTAIESFLSKTVDQEILNLRKYVAQAIDLFEVVISNMQQYQEKIDEIIVTYYKFLDYVYESIRKYFSEEY